MKTTNLSKIRREKMLNTINEIKKNISDEETLSNLSMIENELTKKKYGLIWEEHEERVDKELETQIPTFEEVKEKEIICNPNEKFNFLLEGDNLHSLYLLEKTHKEKIDVIYIDPPYNTGSNDFIYNDKIIEKEDGYRHSKWLSFMYKRLTISKGLLNKDGIIFISIDDNEYSQLKLLCDDIFGENNFVGNIIWEKRTKCQNTKTAKYMLQSKTESILVYKNKNDKYEFNLEFECKRKYPNIDENGNKYRLEQVGEMSASGIRARNTMVFEYNGVSPKKGNQWKFGKDTFDKFNNRKDLIIKNGKAYFRIRPLDEEDKLKPFWSLYLKDIGTAETAKRELNEILNNKQHGFETVKPVNLIKSLLNHVLGTKKDAIILDFFAGSGTTGQAVMELNKEDNGNRQFILCTDNQNNICEDITYQRLKTVITGKRNDKSKYSEGISNNLKYYRTSYIPRINSEENNLHDNLLINIKKLIQLENGIEIDDKRIRVYLREEELDEFSMNEEQLKNCDKLYISSDILLTSEQEEIFDDNNIEVFIIPEYYFEDEIMEGL